MTDISTSSAIRDLFPIGLEGDDLEALCLYLEKYKVINELLSYTATDLLSTLIDGRYPELEHEWFNGPKRTGMYVVNRRHSPNAAQAEINPMWPYYLTVAVDRVLEDEDIHSDISGRSLTVSVHAYRGCHDDLKQISAEFAKQYDAQTRRSNWKSASRKLLGPMENLDFSDPTHPLWSLLEDFLAKTRDIQC